MPITYAAKDDGGIPFKGTGFVSGTEIKEINDAIYVSPENILKIKYQLCDLTNVALPGLAWEKVQFTAIKENSNPVMVKVSESTCVGFNELNTGVNTF